MWRQFLRTGNILHGKILYFHWSQVVCLMRNGGCGGLNMSLYRAAADGGAVLWPDYELEQLCAKLTLMELQSLCKGLYAEGASRADQTAVLQVSSSIWVDGFTHQGLCTKRPRQ